MIDTNCNACVVAAELRVRGLRVTAVEKVQGSALHALVHDYRDMWRTEEGKLPEPIKINSSDAVTAEKQMLKYMRERRRYVLAWDITYKLGHIVSAFKHKGKLFLYDNQIYEFDTLERICQEAVEGTLEMFRIDDLLFNIEVVKDVVRPSR